jgi:hypothetical protein
MGGWNLDDGVFKPEDANAHIVWVDNAPIAPDGPGSCGSRKFHRELDAHLGWNFIGHIDLGG